MPKNKILSCIPSHQKNKVAYTLKAPLSSNSNITEEAKENFRKAVQSKINELKAKTIRDEVEENLLQAFKLIIEKISPEIHMTQKDKNNKKIQETQKIPLSFQTQLQAVSLKSQSENKTKEKVQNQLVISNTDLQQNRLKRVKKLDRTQSQGKEKLSELERKLAKQRGWEKTNNSTSEEKYITPLKIETDPKSKSIVETKDKIQFTEYSEYEKKAINLLNSLKQYLEIDKFENIEFRVMEDICNGFNEQNLQELINYEKEIKNGINTKDVSNDLNEHDLDNVNRSATEKTNFPVEVIHRFRILSTIIEEPENRYTSEMYGSSKQQRLMDELDNLLQELHEFIKEPEQSNFSQPATASFFLLSNHGKKFDLAESNNFLSRP